MFDYAYYSHWNRWKKRPVEHLGRNAAHSCHESRRPYTVAVSAPCMGSRRYSSIIEFEESQARLTVLDRRFRDYLTCQFEEGDKRNMFLRSATYREYRGDSDSVKITEEYAFQEGGSVHFEKRHFQEGVLASRTGKMDVCWNWEPYPTFGDYDTMLEIRWVCRLGEI